MISALDRVVIKIAPIDFEFGSVDPVSFRSYLEAPNVVLLGDPGAGKSHVFKEGSQLERGTLLTSRIFQIYGLPRASTDVLYIDALDEKRSRSDDYRGIDEIIRSLNGIKPRKLRLSCRAADWLGDTDLAAFLPYFQSTGGYVVVSLQPLSDEEVAGILESRGEHSPDKFINEAGVRNVDGLLRNPQTLIMLHAVVADSGWPQSKLDLYSRSTSLLLLEHDKTHSRRSSAQCAPTVLRSCAGAVCASLLLADVETISLLANGGARGDPSYTDVPVEPKEAILACLTRRAFSSRGPDAVGFVHRTVAEYLAAEWIVGKVHDGFPLGRVRSLLGIDGVPASELRGLHAWIATLLQSESLIRSDPYGVLVYGDPSVFSTDTRRLLLRALETLERRDPWFRSGHWLDHPLGALASKEMVRHFRDILRDPSSGHHLRSVVLDAIKCGPQLNEMMDDLVAIVADENSLRDERSDACAGLLRMTGGDRELIKLYHDSLGNNDTSIWLRARIIRHLYESHFTAEDVCRLFEQALRAESDLGTALWELGYYLPESSLEDILDCLSNIDRDRDSLRGHNEYEFTSSFKTILGKVLSNVDRVDPQRLLNWLLSLHRFRGRGAYAGRDSKVKPWLTARPELLLEMFGKYIDALSENANPYSVWREFSEAILGCLQPARLSRWILHNLTGKQFFLGNDVLLYEIALWLAISEGPREVHLFSELVHIADEHTEVMLSRKRLICSNVDSWRIDDRNRRKRHEIELQRMKERHEEEFAKGKDLIRSGRHIGWLTFLAKCYFGLFVDLDREAMPQDRLSFLIGEGNVEYALEALRASLKRDDLPTPSEVGRHIAMNKHYEWWYAILAGMDESWNIEPDLQKYDDHVLASVLSVEEALPTFDEENGVNTRTRRAWKNAIVEQRAAFVADIFEQLARTELEARCDRKSAVVSLFADDRLRALAIPAALRLLNDFPNAGTFPLHELISSVISDNQYHAPLAKLAGHVVGASRRVGGGQRNIWLAVGFILCPNGFKTRLIRRCATNPEIVWTLRDFIGSTRPGAVSNLGLSPSQMEVVIRALGKHFAYAAHPLGTWGGDTNSWDASEFLCSLINKLSACPEDEAENCLERLTCDRTLNSYRSHILHAAEEQRKLRLEQRIRRPSWPQVIDVLSKGIPVDTSDLWALGVDTFRELQDRLTTTSTDIFKSFWNENSFAQVTGPKPEDSCRDRLIELIRPTLDLNRVRTEPEGHMASDKRADIILSCGPEMTVPIEVKRHYHTDLWSACKMQLQRLYTRDPETEGYGIYVVLWFGEVAKRRIPKPPRGILRPKSPLELEESLGETIDRRFRERIKVIVFDLCPHSSKLGG